MARVHSDRFNLTTLSLGLLLLTLLCTPAGAQTGSATGRVLIDNGGIFEPPNERIRIFYKGPYEVRIGWTNPDGTFVMAGLRVGRWIVRVSEREYKQSLPAAVVVTDNQTTRVTPEPIILQRLKPRPTDPEPSDEGGSAGTISGQVLLQSGKEVEPPGMKLKILVKGAFETRFIYTSADGKFFITGFRGRSKLEVRQRGFRQRDEAYADVGVPVTIIVERVGKN